jgi:hypothetical protein
MADQANPEMTKHRIQVAVSWPLFLLKMVLCQVLHTDKRDRSDKSDKRDKSDRRRLEFLDRIAAAVASVAPRLV